MGFVPGKKHDLFLSYAHDDVKWVNAFEKALSERLTILLNRVDIWQDEKKLRAGGRWTADIENGAKTRRHFWPSFRGTTRAAAGARER